MNRYSRLLVPLLVALAAAPAPALAQRQRSPAQGSETFELAPEGVQIRYPGLVAAMERVRSGDAEAAIAEARRAVSAAKPRSPDAAEAALALGMLQLRAGRADAARQTLRPLVPHADPAVAARAGLMLRVAGLKDDAVTSRGLAGIDPWAAALVAAADGCVPEIDRVGQSMLKAVDADQFKDVSAGAGEVRARLAEVRAARIHEMEGPRCDAERKALKAIADAVRRTNERRANLDAECDRLHETIRAARRPSSGRRQPVSSAALPADIGRYNALREQHRTATAACQFLVSTYQETRRESSCTIPLEGEVKVAKGRDRLPEHINP
jgi:hypothetical protein